MAVGDRPLNDNPLPRSPKGLVGKRKACAIVAQQRSGTHFLLSLLNSHSNIAGAGEVLHHKASSHNFYDYWASCVVANRDSLRPNHVAKVWREFVAELHQVPEARTVVMIVMYNQLAALQARLHDEVLFNQPVIHLVRRNVLRTYISDYVNRSRMAPTHTRKDVAPLMVSLPTDDLLEALRGREATISALRDQLRRHPKAIEVTYEDLVQSRAETLSRLLAFIGVPGEELGTNLKMTNPWPLREMLTNFEDVERLLAPTEFAELLG